MIATVRMLKGVTSNPQLKYQLCEFITRSAAEIRPVLFEPIILLKIYESYCDLNLDSRVMRYSNSERNATLKDEEDDQNE